MQTQTQAHTLSFKIKLKPGDRELLEKRFKIMNRVHNVIAKYAQKQLRRLRRDKAYKATLDEYMQFKDIEDEENSKSIEKKVSRLKKELAVIRESYDLTKSGLESYAKVQGEKYKKHLSSQQIQKEADRVYAGVEKVLFGDGKTVHLRKISEMTTICGKNATNGFKLFDKYHDFLKKATDRTKLKDGFMWIDHYFDIDIDYEDPYVLESLNNEVSYCEVKRESFNDGWHYYLNVYLKGAAPKKHKPGKSTTGIDQGTSIMAAASQTKVFLRELAPNVGKYEKEICKIQQAIDRSKRIHNPDNYNDDGTCKKGKHEWVITKNCRRLERKQKTLHRKKAAYAKQSHEELANELIEDSSLFYVEPLDYKALAKRVKNTEREDKVSEVKQKDGTVKMVHKYKRKKRFGHSISSRAPSSLITILKRKCNQYGLLLFETDKWEYKASQYDHTTGKCSKSTLNEREKKIGDVIVQRDLYSAFLTAHPVKSLKHPNKRACKKDFDNFVKLMQQEIAKMKAAGISKKECFGF